MQAGNVREDHMLEDPHWCDVRKVILQHDGQTYGTSKNTGIYEKTDTAAEGVYVDSTGCGNVSDRYIG